jgi:hypothetical protein
MPTPASVSTTPGASTAPATDASLGPGSSAVPNERNQSAPRSAICAARQTVSALRTTVGGSTCPDGEVDPNTTGTRLVIGRAKPPLASDTKALSSDETYRWGTDRTSSPTDRNRESDLLPRGAAYRMPLRANRFAPQISSSR